MTHDADLLDRYTPLIAEAAAAFRVDFRYAEEIARAAVQRMQSPEDQRAEALKMAATGATDGTIALRVGVAASTIRRWLANAE